MNKTKLFVIVSSLIQSNQNNKFFYLHKSPTQGRISKNKKRHDGPVGLQETPEKFVALS